MDDNAELFGIQEADHISGTHFILTDWMLVLHMRDLEVDEYSDEANEVRAAFFRPGMGYSQKLGMVEALNEGVRFPRVLDDEDED